MGMEKRQSIRQVLTGYLPGKFYNADNQPLEYVLYDISEQGLGVFLDPGPEEGEIVVLKLKRGKPAEFTFRVQWTARETGLDMLPEMEGLKRCGLFLNAPHRGTVNLVKLFVGLEGVAIKS
jgi:hypothetical protein